MFGRGAPLRASLAQIDDEIVQWHAHLSLLHATRKSILDRLELVAYPVLSLPVEITAEIFRHYVDVAHIGLLSYHDHGPLVLASVCQAWRAIAIGTSALWSDFTIGTNDRNMASLDVTGTGITGPILPRLALQSDQWEEFECEIVEPTDFPTHLVHGKIPSLQSLTLLGDTDFINDPLNVDGHISAFSDAPALQKVHLLYVPFEIISLPWTQLRKLTLTGHQPSDCVEILRHTPNLRTLVLRHLDIEYDATRPPTVCLDSLRKLTIIGEEGIDCEIIDFLTLPALKDLRILMPDAEERYSHLSQFVRRSACTLESITVTDISDDLHDNGVVLSTFLGLTPTVTALTLTDVSWASLRSFVHRMCIDNSHNGGFRFILPNLQILDITMEATRIPYHDIIRLLKQRRIDGNRDLSTEPDDENVSSREPAPNQAQLRSFRYRIPKEKEDIRKPVQELHDFIAGGCDITFDRLNAFTLDDRSARTGFLFLAGAESV
ncbi:hypothetical protein C8F01DRAFT_1371386 [Mycena amicta]|nr:hypothetical protein C8F01DRAFT_1371386 [Mycena amicta]